MRKYKRYISLVLVILLTLSLTACKGEIRTADSYIMKTKDVVLNVSSEVKDKEVFTDTAQMAELKRISRTDMTALLFNEKSLSVCAYDSGSGKKWRALPEEYRNEAAAEIFVTLLIDGNEYILSSRSDSFVNNGINYEKKENSIVISYSFRQTLEDKRVIDITVPVEYIGQDGAVTVNIDCSAIAGEECDKDIVIKSISLLPYFGAFSDGTGNDFLLLPDGCGAAVSCKPGKEKESFSVRVYGNDPSYETAEGATAVIPAFGMNCGDSSFAALIGEGAAISTIKAEKASKTEGYNRIYPEFELTPVRENEDGTYYVSSSCYEGKISVTYRFLSQASTDYVGMAAAVRELLIAQEKLSAVPSSEDGQYPFNLRVIVSAEEETENGRTKTEYPCSYSQCQDILMSLKAKDVNSINVICSGILNSAYSPSARLELGGSLSELCDYAALSGVKIFATADLLTVDKNGSVSLDGENTLNGKAAVGHPDSIEENSKKLLTNMMDTKLDGICIGDASSVLYTDFTKGIIGNRGEIMTAAEKEIRAASAVKELMVEKGNIYSVKYASAVVDLPEKAFYGESKAVEAVPFVQAVLHSVVDYSHSPVNLSENSTDEFLKAVEYGAMPFYEWYYENKGDEENPDSRYYMNSITQAQSNYIRMRETFADLTGERITGHLKVKSGVYLTEYGNRTQIYVNYNDKPVTVSGVTVDAKSFIRVN